MDLSSLRREYTQSGLRRSQLPPDPLTLFELWLQQAVEAKLSDPTAMTVATVDSSGQPSQRIVLLKQFNEKGFVFYTNLGSNKAKQLSDNPKICLHFPWHALDRQVQITGIAQPLSKTEVMKYFLSRPKESQLAAWASKQSERISSRTLLESKFLELKQQFMQGEIPTPTFWGGFCVVPNAIEFWQGGQHRLHDRFLYEKGQNNDWQITRLAP
ncbi:MAG: pyridoxamine 5'-phosphate oxidase [Vibrionaceae bacterium]